MKPKDTPKQYVIYSRKSKFTGKGESIENQIELCRQYIALHFGEDASENVLVYEDEGFSGGNLERPQFKKMMKDSQKIAFAAIVVYRFDRISRNIGDFAKLIEDLGDRHIDFISIREQFDVLSHGPGDDVYCVGVLSAGAGDHRRAHPGQHARAVQDRTLAGRHNAHGLRLRKPVQRDGGRQGKESLQAQAHPGGNPAGQDDLLRIHGKPVLSARPISTCWSIAASRSAASSSPALLSGVF